MSDDLVSRLKSCAKDCTMLGDEVDAAFFNEAATPSPSTEEAA